MAHLDTMGYPVGTFLDHDGPAVPSFVDRVVQDDTEAASPEDAPGPRGGLLNLAAKVIPDHMIGGEAE